MTNIDISLHTTSVKLLLLEKSEKQWRVWIEIFVIWYRVIDNKLQFSTKFGICLKVPIWWKLLCVKNGTFWRLQSNCTLFVWFIQNHRIFFTCTFNFFFSGQLFFKLRNHEWLPVILPQSFFVTVISSIRLKVTFWQTAICLEKDGIAYLAKVTEATTALLNHR